MRLLLVTKSSANEDELDWTLSGIVRSAAELKSPLIRLIKLIMPRRGRAAVPQPGAAAGRQFRLGSVADVVPPLQMQRRATCRPAAPLPPLAGSAAVSPKVGERADGTCQGAGALSP